MGRGMHMFAAAFLMLMLVVATETSPMVVEEWSCYSRSKLFGGSCNERDCENVCKTEGFHGSHCRWIFLHHRYECYCIGPCSLEVSAEEPPEDTIADVSVPDLVS